MHTDFDNASAAAEATLRTVRLDGEQAPDMRLLCRRLAVKLEVVAPFVLRGGHAGRYSAVGDRIVRRRGLPAHLEAFVLAHELGHRWRARLAIPFDESEERWCNAYAGALLVPLAPLFAVWHRGHDLADLIETYPNVAPTCLALRLGETRLARAVVVVQGRDVRHVRNTGAPGPGVVALGIEAARRGHASSPGLAKAWRMPESPNRAAVVMDVG